MSGCHYDLITFRGGTGVIFASSLELILSLLHQTSAEALFGHHIDVINLYACMGLIQVTWTEMVISSGSTN